VRDVANAKRRVSYAWSGHTEVADRPLSELSAAAEEGLLYARDLAADACERVRRLFANEQLDPPATIAELADRAGRSPAEVRRLIARARRELFGSISDAAIYKRKQRLKPVSIHI
jgi:hypothetical protein